MLEPVLLMKTLRARRRKVVWFICSYWYSHDGEGVFKCPGTLTCSPHPEKKPKPDRSRTRASQSNHLLSSNQLPRRPPPSLLCPLPPLPDPPSPPPLPLRRCRSPAAVSWQGVEVCRRAGCRRACHEVTRGGLRTEGGSDEGRAGPSLRAPRPPPQEPLLLLFQKKKSVHRHQWVWRGVGKNMELRGPAHLLPFKPPRRKGLASPLDSVGLWAREASTWLGLPQASALGGDSQGRPQGCPYPWLTS